MLWALVPTRSRLHVIPTKTLTSFLEEEGHKKNMQKIYKLFTYCKDHSSTGNRAWVHVFQFDVHNYLFRGLQVICWKESCLQTTALRRKMPCAPVSNIASVKKREKTFHWKFPCVFHCINTMINFSSRRTGCHQNFKNIFQVFFIIQRLIFLRLLSWITQANCQMDFM